MKALTVSSYFATFFSASFCCKLMKLSITELAVSFQHLFAFLANPYPFGILSNHPAFCVGKETFLFLLLLFATFVLHYKQNTCQVFFSADAKIYLVLVNFVHFLVFGDLLGTISNIYLCQLLPNCSTLFFVFS